MKTVASYLQTVNKYDNNIFKDSNERSQRYNGVRRLLYGKVSKGECTEEEFHMYKHVDMAYAYPSSRSIPATSDIFLDLKTIEFCIKNKIPHEILLPKLYPARNTLHMTRERIAVESFPSLDKFLEYAFHQVFDISIEKLEEAKVKFDKEFQDMFDLVEEAINSLSK